MENSPQHNKTVLTVNPTCQCLTWLRADNQTICCRKDICMREKRDIGCALSITISHHVILSHLHDIIASRHLAITKMLQIQCPIAHLMSCCTPNVLLHTQCPIICIPNVLLHTQCPVVHLMSCCTPNVLLHTQCPVAHPMSCCTPNVLLYT